jgi:hypothetical protein
MPTSVSQPMQVITESLVLPTGQPYGKSWAAFQERFFAAIFATVTDKKRGKSVTRPRFRLLYDERRRGESKTEDLAAAALADLLTGPDWHRSYVVAADSEQAALVIDAIRGFQARSPILADVQVMRTTVLNPITNSELRVMSADDRTIYGIKPRRVFFDELSLQLDDRLWRATWSAIGKNPASQMVCCSMAGNDFASIGWKVRELARTDDSYYFASREDSGLAPWLSERDMDEQRATLHPADFARFWECRWTEPAGAWISAEMYANAEKGKEAHRGDGHSRYVGFVDLGLTHDATAIAVCHGAGERVILDTLVTLQGNRNESVQLEAVEAEVIALTSRFGVKSWVFESWQGVGSVQRLQSRLRGTTVEARHATADTQNTLWSNLYYLFQNDLITVYPHERLRKEALSLVTKKVGGRIKPVDSSSVHQDHILAVGGAATLLIPEDDPGPMVVTWQDWRQEAWGQAVNVPDPDWVPEPITAPHIGREPGDYWEFEDK